MDVEILKDHLPVKTSTLLIPTSTGASFTSTTLHQTSVSATTMTYVSSATHVNPVPTHIPVGPVVQAVGHTGMRTLWVVFVLMLISTIIFSALAFRVPVQKRLFHILTAFITAFATLSYFAMATGDGNSFSRNVKYEHPKGMDPIKHETYRQVFWARYVDWAITTPLLLLDLAFLAGMNGANMLVTIVADVLMVLTGLFAAFGRNKGQKWGYYFMGIAAFLVVIYQLVVPGRKSVLARDSKTSKFYTSIAAFTLIIWSIYPIAWAIGDGARKISVDTEVVIYAILDILAKPVFGFWLLLTHDRLASSNVILDGAWAHGFGKREGTLRVGDDDEGA